MAGIRFTIELYMNTGEYCQMYSGITSIKDDASLRDAVATLRNRANELYTERHFRVPCSGMIRFTYKGKSLLITY